MPMFAYGGNTIGSRFPADRTRYLSFHVSKRLRVLARRLSALEHPGRSVAARAHDSKCDGFRMPAPSLNSPRAPWPPGRRSKAANGGNRGRWRTDQRALWELYERDRCQEGAASYFLFLSL